MLPDAKPLSEHEFDRFKENFIESINLMSTQIYHNAIDKGFYEEERNFGETIALKHSELSEALEAHRDGNPISKKIPPYTHVEEELADCIIRILDTCKYRGYNIAGAILAKHKYNTTRPYKHNRAY